MSNYKQLLKLAEVYYKEKNFIYSEALLRKVIKISPQNSKANELLAYIYAEQGNCDLSFEFLELACQKDSCSPEALYYLGSFQLKRNLLNQAIVTLKKAINKNGVFFEALHDLGVCYGHVGKIKESISCYEKCLKLRGDSYELYFNIGRCFDELKRYDEALLNYDKAIKLKPEFDIAWLNKGVTLNELGRSNEAIIQYEQLIKLNPKSFEAWSYKAAALNDLGCPDEAILSCDEAIRLNPDYAEAWSNKGVALNDLSRYDEALFHYDQAIRLRPEYAEIWSNKGATLQNLKRFNEAFLHYEEAIRLKPSYEKAYLNRAMLKLNLKDFDEGWQEYEVRIKDKKTINFEFPFNLESIPVWDGSTSCNHLLVIHEQGVGDQIFYASMLLPLQSIVKKITVLIDARLIPIFSRSFKSINFIDKKSLNNESEVSAQIAIGSLPRVLRSIFFEFNGLNPPYLFDDFSLTNKLKNSELFKNKFTCGVSWKSSNKKLGMQKSINLVDLTEVLNVSNCEFINLQYGDITQEIRDLERIKNIKLNNINDIDIYSNIDGLLSIIQSCDIVITTSNINAHLAGAIGKKTLLLLPYSQGRIWYWHDEAESSWYPSIKQYFEDPNLGYHNVIKEIAAELRYEVDRKN
jgi:tetratricopeptide (TPR) repeat protein